MEGEMSSIDTEVDFDTWLAQLKARFIAKGGMTQDLAPVGVNRISTAAFAFLVVVAKAMSYLPCDGVGGGMRLFFSISCR